MASLGDAAMEDLPPPTRRIAQVVASVSTMPVELIQNVLDDLPLHRVLEIACAPTATPQLLGAIESSPSWGWLFGGNMARLQNVWTSFNRLSWVWCGERLIAVPELYHKAYLENTHEEMRRLTDRPIEQLETNFLAAFLQLIGLRYPVGCRSLIGLTFAELEAICMFLPAESISDLQLKQSPEHTEGGGESSERPPAEKGLDSLARALQAHEWSTETAEAFLPVLVEARRRMLEAKSAELSRLADAYDAFATELRTPEAPQTPRANLRHVAFELRCKAKKLPGKRVRRKLLKCTFQRRWRHAPKVSELPKLAADHQGRASWHFRRPHPVLVPYDWCFWLFNSVVIRNPVPEPGQDAGIYPEHLIPHFRRAVEGFEFIYRIDDEASELLRCTGAKTDHPRIVSYDEWQSALPSPGRELAWLESFIQCVRWIKEANVGTLPRPLLDPEDFKEYVDKEPPEVVARQLRADAELCGRDLDKNLPSLVALYMPSFSSSRARDVATIMWPDVDISVREILYEEMIKKIRHGLERARPVSPPEDGQNVVVGDDAPGEEAKRWPNKKCYICRVLIHSTGGPHAVFGSMCQPCGEFNLAGSRASLPENLDLKGRVALVTGARVNLGFHTALRLLRCGARVVASTRYPRDALERYRAEPDFNLWSGRLRVVGADFRAARDAFALARAVRDVVTAEWGGRLHILINNAAQTLTDAVDREQKAIRRENRLRLEGGDWDLFRLLPAADQYVARVRGGSADALEGVPSQAMIGPASSSSASASATTAVTKAQGPSSWVQSLTEIPYEDFITAHSVNTFVPLILIRELMPLMSVPQPRDTAGYIINVSSREGIFEDRRSASAKNGRHVHTNMSKAGLNMITETEASTAWHHHGVTMNTVDPGYMSAAPEMENLHGGERPIGWEDGAGRVLWPVAMGESTGADGSQPKTRVWGRFLKHYGAVRVDTRFGRG